MRLLGLTLLALTLIAPGMACAENPAVGPFRVVTADLRPFAVENQAAAPGLIVELVEAIGAKVGQPIKVEFYPWARAVALAQAEPRVTVIPLTRTAEREAHFQWLVRLYQQQYVFITKADRPPIRSIDEARKVKRIAVLRGSPTLDFALNNHFRRSNFFEDASIEAGLRDLDAGTVDSYYGGKVISIDTLLATGRQLDHYHFGATLGGGDIWLAASSGFSDSDIAALRSAFDSLVKDGTYARLLKKYEL